MSMPTWVPADERKPAPEPLLLVQSFVNTKDFDQGTDLLTDEIAANGWLHAAGLQGPDVTATAAELQQARDVRESIRALLSGNAREPVARGDLRALEALGSTAKLQPTIDREGRIELTTEPANRLEPGLLKLLLIIRDAQRDGTWSRLKACGNQDCRWAFFDRSHSRQGAWCDMASCGNLIKNRNLRARRGSRAQAGH